MANNTLNKAMIAGALGAAAGATAVVLSDAKNRKKIGKVVANVTHKAQEITEGITEKTSPVIDTVKQMGSDIAEDTKKSKTIKHVKQGIKNTL